MRDLEMTRLCAEAMGLRWYSCDQDGKPVIAYADANHVMHLYTPLTDDAQCFALVKRFNLSVESGFALGAEWHVYGSGESACTPVSDLNRAIVECVANMQKAKA